MLPDLLAIGHCAVRTGIDVMFTTQSQLLAQINAARATAGLDRKMQTLARVPLLIIDDYGQCAGRSCPACLIYLVNNLMNTGLWNYPPQRVGAVVVHVAKQRTRVPRMTAAWPQAFIPG